MPDSSNIREDMFQKQHAEAMQALIWALALVKARAQSLTLKEQQKIEAIKIQHKKALEDDTQLQAAMDAIDQRITNQIYDSDLNKAIDTLKKHEQEYLEDLERKATRHKLSLFFALFMAIGCGTTLAGSNFLMGVQYNWIANVGFLVTIAMISIPIVLVVSMANWWLGVRAVPDLENKNRDPYRLSKKLLGEYAGWKAPAFTVTMFLIEMYNALTYNFEQSDKEKREETKKRKSWRNSLTMRFFWYLAVFLGAVIYGFFAFAATYNLGMGFLEVLRLYGLAGNSSLSFNAAAYTSAGFGILMAVPTYITMKVIYFISAKSWMDPDGGPIKIIEEVPGWDRPRLFGLNLKQLFIIAALMIVMAVGFMTYAAVDPLGAWFKLAGMGSGANILATVTIAIAFIGNIPFYVNCAAKSFKQFFDPREQLESNNSKWFSGVRFWNATMNALPAIVGVLAFLGILGLSGPAALIVPVAVNVFIAAAASYFANSNGTPTMYQFDAAKQVSKYQLSQLSRLSQLKNGESLEQTPYEDMTPGQQLDVEYYGAEIYLKEYDATAKMPKLASALHQTLGPGLLNDSEDVALYQAFNQSFASGATQIFARTWSAFSHDNVRYTKYLFPYDYLSRIEHYGSDQVKQKLYEHALFGGKGRTAAYRGLLGIGGVGTSRQVFTQDFLFGADAELFWKAYSVQDVKLQHETINRIPANIRKEPEVQERLMQHSRPETRKTLVAEIAKTNKINIPYLHDNNLDKVGKWKAAHKVFSKGGTRFGSENILFPAYLVIDSVVNMVSWAMRRLGLGRYIADPLDAYQYLSETADLQTRKTFLNDVLCGYMISKSTSSRHFNIAEKLRLIIDGDDTVKFSPAEISELKSGLVGRVFDIASTIPEIKSRLQNVLNKSAELAKGAAGQSMEAFGDDEKPSPNSSTSSILVTSDLYPKGVPPSLQGPAFPGWVNSHSNQPKNTAH